MYDEKSKHNLWDRTGYTRHLYAQVEDRRTFHDEKSHLKRTKPKAYELLVPNLSETNKLILKDFGYEVRGAYATSEQRTAWYKLLKL